MEGVVSENWALDFSEEFNKEASKARFLAKTRQLGRRLGLFPELGQTWLYHGTSPSKAKSIVREGLKSKPGTGISKYLGGLDNIQKGKVFTDTRKRYAKSYGKQQAALDKRPPKSKGDLEDIQSSISDPFGDEGRVIRFQVPKSKLKEAVENPELRRAKLSPLWEFSSPAQRKSFEKDFGLAKVFNEPLDPKYIDKIQKTHSIKGRALGLGGAITGGAIASKMSDKTKKKSAKKDKDMSKSFKKGFEKRSGLLESLATIATIASSPAIKRYGFKSFDYAKRRALGLPPKKKSIFMEKIYKDLKDVDSMKGIRKMINKPMMEESPLMGLWMGAAQGKKLGEKLNKPLKYAPKRVKEYAADLTSSSDAVAQEAVKKLQKDIAIGVGAGGSAIGLKKIHDKYKKKED